MCEEATGFLSAMEAEDPKYYMLGTGLTSVHTNIVTEYNIQLNEIRVKTSSVS